MVIGNWSPIGNYYEEGRGGARVGRDTFLKDGGWAGGVEFTIRFKMVYCFPAPF